MMYFKKWMWKIALAGMLLATTVQAGGPPWSAWLYAPDTGHVVMVGTDSAVLYDFVLPLPQGFDGLPGQVAVSRGGALLAYVARNSDTGEHQLRVYDVVGQNARVTYNLPQAVGDTFVIRASELNFNSSDSALAYSYALTDGSWEVIVVDTFLGDLLYQLRSDSPAISGQPRTGILLIINTAPVANNSPSKVTIPYNQSVKACKRRLKRDTRKRGMSPNLINTHNARS